MAQYNPNILLEVYQTSTKYYAQRTIVVSGTAYDDGLILNDPEISLQIPDNLYGVIDPWDMEIVIDDLTLVDNEVRGVLCKIQVYDATDGLTFAAYGSIRKYQQDYGRSITLTIRVNDEQELKTLLPKDVVTTTTFHETAMDVGVPINIPLGYCLRVLCPNVKHDTIANHYDYVVGYSQDPTNDGDYEIQDLWEDTTHGVWRGGKLVDTSEYDFLNGTEYDGYAVIRFYVPQWDFSNGFYEIRADVKGIQYWSDIDPPAVQTLIPRLQAIHHLLVSSTFGLNITGIDSADLAAYFTGNEYNVSYCIGNGKQRPAIDIINDLISPYGCIYRASDGEYEVIPVNDNTDQLNDTSDYFGDNDGYYNNCEIVSGPNQLDIDEYPKTLKVNFNFRPDETGKEIYDTSECSETARSYGTDIVYDATTVVNYVSAFYQSGQERVMSILWGRSVYSDYTLTIRMNTEGRSWNIGDKIYAANSDISSISTDWFVVAYRKVYGEKFEFDLRSTHDDFYDYAYSSDTITEQVPSYSFAGVVKKTIDFTAVDGTTYAIDTRGYSKCYNRYRFEPGALTTDTAGNDTLNSNGDPAEDTTNEIEGSCCVALDGDDYYAISDAALSANHPLKSSNSGSVAVALCVRFDSSIIGASTSCNIFTKWVADDYGLVIQKGTTDKVMGRSASADDTYNTTMQNATAVIADNWYGLLYCYDANLGKEYFHVYDITGDAVHGSDIIQSITTFNMSDGALSIGSNVVGIMDHTLIFDEPVQIEDADSIFTDPSNWGPVTMTLTTAPNAMFVTAFDAYSYFNTENFTVGSSAAYYGGSFGTHTYSTDEAWVRYKFCDTNIGYIKMT